MQTQGRWHKAGAEFKLLLKLYKLLLDLSSRTIPYYIREWEKELGCTLSNSSIEKITRLAHTSSVSCKTQVSCYKFLSQRYRVPDELGHIYREASTLC